MFEPTTTASSVPDEFDHLRTVVFYDECDLRMWSRRLGVDHRTAYAAFGLTVLANFIQGLAKRLEFFAEDFRNADASDGYVLELLDLAEGEVGYREGRNNDNKYGQWYGVNHDAWCAMFVSWVFAASGHPLPVIDGKMGFAKVKNIFTWARKNRRLVKRPKAGDIFVIAHGPQKGHTGIVKSVNADGTITTLEGNTNMRGSRSGDGVYERIRTVASINAGFVRINGVIDDNDLWVGPGWFRGVGRSQRIAKKRQTKREKNHGKVTGSKRRTRKQPLHKRRAPRVRRLHSTA